MFSKTSRLIAVAAATIVFGVGQAYAQDEAGACQTVQQPVAAAFNLKDLHDQLNLNAAQEVQWQAAVDAMRQSHSAARMNADEMQVKEAALLQKPILDLAALHAMHEQAEQADAQLPEQSAKAWLAFYSGLDNQQKTLVSTAFKQQFENIAHHPAKPYDPRTGL